MPTSSGALAGTLEFVCSINTNLSTYDMVVPIPSQVDNTWSLMTQYQPGWQGATGQNNGGTGFKSCGAVAIANEPNLVIQFDNYQYAAEMVGDAVTDNKVISPLYSGIQLGATQSAVVTGNYVENAGSKYGGQGAYQFNNSPGTMFSNNTANYMQGAYDGIGLVTGDYAQIQSTTTVSSFTFVNGTTRYSTPADILVPSPSILYSAAGTPLPTCSAAYKGATETVSDSAATPAFMSVYSSGGLYQCRRLLQWNELAGLLT